MAVELFRRWFRRPSMCRGPGRHSGHVCVHTRGKSNSEDEPEDDELDDCDNCVQSSSPTGRAEFSAKVKGDATWEMSDDDKDEASSDYQPELEKAMLLPLPPPPLLTGSQTQQRQQYPALLPSRSLVNRLQTIFEESVISNEGGGCGGDGGCSSLGATAESTDGCRSDDLDELDSLAIFATESPSTSASLGAAVAADKSVPPPPPPTTHPTPQKQTSLHLLPHHSPHSAFSASEQKDSLQSDEQDTNEASSTLSPNSAAESDALATRTGTATTTCSSASASATSQLQKRRRQASSNRCGRQSAAGLRCSANYHLSPVVRLKRVSVEPFLTGCRWKLGCADPTDVSRSRRNSREKSRRASPLSLSLSKSYSDREDAPGLAFALSSSDELASNLSVSPLLQQAQYCDNRSNVHHGKTGAGTSKSRHPKKPASDRLRQSSRFTRVMLEDESPETEAKRDTLASTGSTTPKPTPPPLSRAKKVKVRYNPNSMLGGQFEFEAAAPVETSLVDAIGPRDLTMVGKPLSGSENEGKETAQTTEESTRQVHVIVLDSGQRQLSENQSERDKSGLPTLRAAATAADPAAADPEAANLCANSETATARYPLDELCRDSCGCCHQHQLDRYLQPIGDCRNSASHCQCSCPSCSGCCQCCGGPLNAPFEDSNFCCHASCNTSHWCACSHHGCCNCDCCPNVTHCDCCPSRSSAVCTRQAATSAPCAGRQVDACNCRSRCCSGCHCHTCCGCSGAQQNHAPAHDAPNRYISPAQFYLASATEPLHWFPEVPKQQQLCALQQQQQLHLEHLHTLQEQWRSAAQTMADVQRLCREAENESHVNQSAKAHSAASADQPQVQRQSPRKFSSDNPPSNTQSSNADASLNDNETAAAATVAAAAAAAAVMSALPRRLLAQCSRSISGDSRQRATQGSSSSDSALTSSNCSFQLCRCQESAMIASNPDHLTIASSQEPPSRSKYRGVDSNSSCSISTSSGIKVTGAASVERALHRWARHYPNP